MASKRPLLVGDLVRVIPGCRPWLGPDMGTITAVRRLKILVLFPIRKFVWLFKAEVYRVR